MPRVKIDYIVSFSNEDSENPASNLLAWDVSKKKWLCNKGEPSCSVVLQLAKAVKISSVTIGSHQSALVEVLVGRSETPNDPFQVLVPSSVFQSPGAARRGCGADADKVRSFGADSLAAARDQRWDRLRLVCSQPYNKHCNYGLSFVHVFSSEGSPPGPAPAAPAPAAPAPAVPAPAVPAPAVSSPSAVPARLGVTLDTFSSDEEEFRPGELFAKHLQKPHTTADTGAQIRQATSQAPKNIPDSTIKLTKSPLVKPSTSDKARSSRGHDGDSHRQRDSLIYTADDDRPNDRIDRVINKHNEQKNKETNKRKDDNSKHNNESNSRINKIDSNTNKHNKDGTKDDKNNKRDSINKDDRQTNTPRNIDERHKPDKRLNNTQSKDVKQGDGASTQDRTRDGTSHDKNNVHATGSRTDETRKRTHSDKKHGIVAGAVRSAPHALLADVVLVLSGYQHPRRAALRTAALALGARAARDWGPACTHLICAFPNTPKLRAVRSAPHGGRAVVVRGEWLEECARTRRRLPWQWFATEPARRVPAPRGWDDHPPHTSESDTDDEIERVRQKMKKQRHASPPPAAASPPSPAASPPPAPRDVSASSNTSDVLFVADERMQGSVTVVQSDSEGSTDAESAVPGGQSPREPREACLPDLFAGLAFTIQAAPERHSLIERYLRAYGGFVTQDADSEVDYIICDSSVPSAGLTRGRGAVCVRAAWVWRCHAHRRLQPTHTYTLAST